MKETDVSELHKKASDVWNTRKPMQEICERLEEEKRIAQIEMEECIFKALPYHDNTEGRVIGIKKAIEICKEVGGMND